MIITPTHHKTSCFLFGHRHHRCYFSRNMRLVLDIYCTSCGFVDSIVSTGIWLESLAHIVFDHASVILSSQLLFRIFDGTVFIGDVDGPITVMDGTSGAVTTIEVC
jgi:hypothetical protein